MSGFLRFFGGALLLCVITFPMFACVSATQAFDGVSAAESRACPLSAKGVENFYKISDGLYRSAQPTEAGFRSLRPFGITSVLNLRNYHSDDDEAAGTGLTLLRYRMNAGSITEIDLRKCLELIRDADGPVLVHCWHGSDRTGAVCAAYRIVFENWTAEEALEEMFYPPFGHHRRVYPNIAALIRGIDWAKMRESVMRTDASNSP